MPSSIFSKPPQAKQLRPSPLVLLAGHVTLDRYGEELIPGGTVTYAALTYAGLGARVRAVTAAATDFPLQSLPGMEIQLVDAPHTTTFVNSYNPAGERTQRVEALAPPIEPDRVPRGWLHADVLHLAPILGEIEVGGWVRAVHARFVGINVQGLVRALKPDGKVVQPPWRPSLADLRGVHAAVIGEDDLSGQGDLLDRLVASIPVVAFTHGDEGCELILRGRTVQVDAYHTHEVDPTGAGDVFSAGFFLGLAEGADPVDAARLGAAAASIVVEDRAADALWRIPEAHARRKQLAEQAEGNDLVCSAAGSTCRRSR